MTFFNIDAITLSNEFKLKGKDGSTVTFHNPEHLKILEQIVKKSLKEQVNFIPKLPENCWTFKINNTPLSIPKHSYCEINNENISLDQVIVKAQNFEKIFIDSAKKIQEHFFTVSNATIKNFESTTKISTDSVITATDKIAAYRNLYKAFLGIIQIVLFLMIITGACSPVGMAILGIAAFLVGLAGLIYLKYTLPNDQQQFWSLFICVILATASCFITGFVPGHELILHAIYGALLMLQGFLFSSQGLIWFFKNHDKQTDALTFQDHKTEETAKLIKIGNGIQIAEGALWVVMGLCRILFAATGLPMLDNLDYWITFFVFFISFNICYILSAYISWGHILKIQNKFHDYITQYLPEKKIEDVDNLDPQSTIKTLEALKHKFMGSFKNEKLKGLSKGYMNTNRMEKKLMRLQEVTDSTILELIDIEYLNQLLHGIRNKDDNSLKISKTIIKEIIRSNERNIALYTKMRNVALMGFLIGLPMTTGCEIFEGSKIPAFNQFYNSLTPNQQMLSSGIMNLVECGFWFALNLFGFLEMDKAPDISDEERKDIIAIKENRGKALNEDETQWKLDYEKKIKEISPIPEAEEIS
jgi:hypothetical protein